MSHPNLSWRAQAKPIIALDIYDYSPIKGEFPSLWFASHWVAKRIGCKPETAKKEIRKALRTGVPRYGSYWRYKYKY